MTRRSAQPDRGYSAPVAESGSRPVITTGSHSRQEPTSTGVVDGGKVVMKPTAEPTETNSQPMRHEAWMRKAAKEADRLHKKLTEKMSSSSSDLVHKPSHYNQSGIECIEAIRAALGPEGFRDYCQGNAMKYLWRHKYKNGKQDIEKAQVYLNWLHEAYDD